MARKMQRILSQRIRTIPIAAKKHKVVLSMFGDASPKGESFQKFIDSLPDILAAQQFRACVEAIVRARRRLKPVIFCMGGHVIKCGLSRVIIDLMQRGAVTAIAMNGAASVHDFEIALIGRTSEDVQEGLRNGTFGMAEETGAMVNEALAIGNASGLGAGWAIGRYILERKLPHRNVSLLAQSVRLRMPATVHIAIGTDTIHQHPHADGAVLGQTSMNDFKMFTDVVACLGGGGVVLNVGSAVIMPEVFLKALTVARNSGRRVTDFTAITLDMMIQYRALENVVRRPVAAGGRGFYLIGHHEIMVPLLARAIIDKL